MYTFIISKYVNVNICKELKILLFREFSLFQQIHVLCIMHMELTKTVLFEEDLFYLRKKFCYFGGKKLFYLWKPYFRRKSFPQFVFQFFILELSTSRAMNLRKLGNTALCLSNQLEWTTVTFVTLSYVCKIQVDNCFICHICHICPMFVKFKWNKM